MGQEKKPDQIAFMGDRAAFVQEVAAQLAESIAQMVQIEPPMDKEECAKYLGFGLTHIDTLVAAGMPCVDFAAPGAKIRALRFWRHKIAEWQGTGGSVILAEMRMDLENKSRRRRRP